MHYHDISICTYKYKVVYRIIQNVDVFMTQCTDTGEIISALLRAFKYILITIPQLVK